MEMILASASPRRKELLAMLGIPFSIDPAVGEEHCPDSLPANQAAEFLAVRKAAEVAKRHPDAIVIGADTTVILEDEILGKPKSKEDCIAMLSKLSGRQHLVQTGVALFCRGKSLSFTEETQVSFYPLTIDEIIAYAETDEPYDKAGGYGIQGKAALLISGICGDYYNVMGLPIARLSRQLQTLRSICHTEEI
ncbi:MAG: septum formation protein Maf [Oscillospiraceae bacterium]|nr:septum formation protein Maf [Oscillospiraceae bacterium]